MHDGVIIFKCFNRYAFSGTLLFEIIERNMISNRHQTGFLSNVGIFKYFHEGQHSIV